MSLLEASYKALTAEASKDLKGEGVAAALGELVGLGLRFLVQECDRTPLRSGVPNKQYFCFRPRGSTVKMSRPVNTELFDPSVRRGTGGLTPAGLRKIRTDVRAKLLYTAAMSYCLPDQWAMYQMFIAQMHRVSYLDPPEKYLPLSRWYPFIQVKHFASFFDEAESLASGSPLA